MSKFPKSARHPDVENIAQLWRELAIHVNVEEESRLADLPDLQIACRSVLGGERAIEYIAPAREIVCGNAMNVVAKGFETLDAMDACSRERINISAVVLCYHAALFFARAFCLLMGFAPANRQSNITVDVFRQEQRQSKFNQVEGMKLHKYRRWQHKEVWELTRRLVDTLRVPECLRETKSVLRKTNLEEMSTIRNSFSYDDAILSPLDSDFSDFPDVARRMISGKLRPKKFSETIEVVRCLSNLCDFVLEQADLNAALRKLASARRMQTGMKILS